MKNKVIRLILNAKLKPCPLCGKSSSVEPVDGMDIYDFVDEEIYHDMGFAPEYTADPYYHMYYLGCAKRLGGCGAFLSKDVDKDAAIQAWNTRTNEKD